MGLRPQRGTAGLGLGLGRGCLLVQILFRVLLGTRHVVSEPQAFNGHQGVGGCGLSPRLTDVAGRCGVCPGAGQTPPPQLGARAQS